MVPTLQAPIPCRAVLRRRLRIRCILRHIGLRYLLHEWHCWDVGMVLDICTSGLDLISEITLIRGRFSRGVRPFASESLHPSVRVSFTKPPSRLVTPANSDGRLSIDCQVPDPRGEEPGDVDQKYESPTYPSTRRLTHPSQSTRRALLGRRSTLRSATSLWLSQTGKFGCTSYFPGRSVVLVRHVHFSGPSWRLINSFSFRDHTLLALDRPRIRLFSRRF